MAKVKITITVSDLKKKKRKIFLGTILFFSQNTLEIVLLGWSEWTVDHFCKHLSNNRHFVKSG